MAHVEKYTIGAIGHMTNHYGRSDAPPIERSNENIDPERTKLNYNLASSDQPNSQVEFIHRRMKEVRVQKRKDVNVMCDWIVTKPHSLPDSYSEAFFKSVYKFMCSQYGKENVVSAYVHRDEVSDHMHFAFMPVVPDQRRGGLKISAKEVLTRQHLREFHTSLQNAVERDLGFEVDILNGATKEGNKAISELKRATAAQVLQEQHEWISKHVTVDPDHLQQQVIKTSEKGFGKNRHTEITIDKKVYDELLLAARQTRKLADATFNAQRMQNQFENQADRAMGEAAGLRRSRLEYERSNDYLAAENEDLKQILANIEYVLDQQPAPVKEKILEDLQNLQEQQLQEVAAMEWGDR